MGQQILTLRTSCSGMCSGDWETHLANFIMPGLLDILSSNGHSKAECWLASTHKRVGTSGCNKSTEDTTPLHQCVKAGLCPGRTSEAQKQWATQCGKHVAWRAVWCLVSE